MRSLDICHAHIGTSIRMRLKILPFVDGNLPMSYCMTPHLSRFSHGPETSPREDLRRASPRAILPTERVFQASIDGAGACNLPIAWTSCGRAHSLDAVHTGGHSFCGDGTHAPNRHDDSPTIRIQHDFDEVVSAKDSYLLDMQSEGSILHYQNEKRHIKASEDSLRNVSIYTERYFQPVLEDLRSRGLELMMRIPEKSASDSAGEDKWDPLFITPYKDTSIEFTKPLKTKTQTIKSYVRPLESSFDYSLPNNYSRRSEESEVQLPNFSIDFTEYVLGSMIERVSDSFDLYATIFLLAHDVLVPKNDVWASTVLQISHEVYDVWMRASRNFEKTAYAPTGVRITPPAFYCNISHTPDGPYYIVEGQFVSNKATPDSNANNRLDILRCKMVDTENAYMSLAGSSHKMHIEIFRGDFSLMSFRIPWGIRKTGYMLDEPDDQIVTKLDPWKGFNKNTPGVWTHDRLHMCVSGWEDAPSKINLPVLFEWIQHHVLMGASHIFAGVTFDWGSPHMRAINHALASFRDDGLVSVTSHVGDRIDGAYRCTFLLSPYFPSEHTLHRHRHRHHLLPSR